MKHWRNMAACMRVVAVGLCSVGGVGACAGQQQRVASEMVISPKGNAVAFFARGTFAQSEPTRVAWMERAMGTATWADLPAGWKGQHLLWLDDQRVYVEALRQQAGGWIWAVGNEPKWTQAPYLTSIWYPPFRGAEGSGEIFASGEKTDIYAAADLKRIGGMEYPVRGVGDGWMLRYQWPAGLPMVLTSQGWLREVGSTPNGARTLKLVQLAGLDLLDPARKVIMHVDGMGLDPQLFTDKEAALSPDHKILMLAPHVHGLMGGSRGPDTIMSREFHGFLVFEVPTAKLLFDSKIVGVRGMGQGTPGGAGVGVSSAVLEDDGVYEVEEVAPEDPRRQDPNAPARVAGPKDHTFWLCRYTAQGRERLVQLPLEGGKPFTTAADAKLHFMDIHTYYPRHRIVEAPLKPGVKEADLRYFNLPEEL